MTVSIKRPISLYENKKPSNSATPFGTSTIHSVLTMWTLEITSAQFTRRNWNLRERPSENHAEWSTDHLSDSLHIWHTYAP